MKSDDRNQVELEPRFDSRANEEPEVVDGFKFFGEDEPAVTHSKISESDGDSENGFSKLHTLSSSREASPSGGGSGGRKKLSSNSSLASSKKLPTSKPQGGSPVFGPHIVKKALRELGGKGSGVEVTEWISKNMPFYTQYFGDYKKLRYRCVGILSANAYAKIFKKETHVALNGVKKSVYVLSDDGEPIEEPESYSSSAEVATPISKLSPKEPPKKPAPSRAASDEVKQKEREREKKKLFQIKTKKIPHCLQKKYVYSPLSLLLLFSFFFLQDPYAKYKCQVCNSGGDDEKLLLCDGCDLGYHMFCLEKPLLQVPRGYWFCANCSEEPPAATPEPMDDDDDLDNPRACPKHQRWKKRCPPNCPLKGKYKSK
jgi:hypothetical protein